MLRFIPIPELSQNDVIRFDSKVPNKPEVGCWLWTGTIGGKGYGMISILGKTYYAHRIAYTLASGPIPEGLDLDHTCHNPACVRPSHLEAVNRSEHRIRTYRRDGAIAANSRKTQCLKGHDLTPDNLYNDRGRRVCKVCRLENTRRSRQKRKLNLLHAV